MRMLLATATGVLAVSALVMSMAGCSGAPSSSTATSASATSTPPAESTTVTTTSGPSSSALAQPSDYTGLLIRVTDIDAPIPFTAGPPTANPNGQPGAAILFSSQPHPQDQDGITIHQVFIRDTIHVLPDPAAAANALKSAEAAQGSVVKAAKTDASNVGSGGVMLSGTSPDGSQGVTVLLFAQGRALVTLEFDGPVDSLPPPGFVTDIGQKQADAIKKSS